MDPRYGSEACQALRAELARARHAADGAAQRREGLVQALERAVDKRELIDTKASLLRLLLGAWVMGVVGAGSGRVCGGGEVVAWSVPPATNTHHPQPHPHRHPPPHHHPRVRVRRGGRPSLSALKT